ncbi:hypothetical protein QYM36_013062 [Artemia franciscana]|uniref:tRNA pseudouridine(55) synthase n=1 Tax=Artemia franciscana TaxID=6661 RepID=A0AA88HLH6_ARTSF|nr:hypothetical protein QYM36_013062 [Artemia franciscana]
MSADMTYHSAFVILTDLLSQGKINEEDFCNHLKLGHGGVLDIDAEGVLVVATFHSCRSLPALLSGTKSYHAVAILGVETDTDNASGKALKEMPYDHITLDKLERCLKDYKGYIWQKPPLYSSLKVCGKRASDLARLGQNVDIEPREVYAESVECTSFTAPKFEIRVQCGGGFYVRSLIRDIGRGLGTCAHTSELLRTSQGPFTLSDCLQEHQWTVGNVNDSIQRHAWKVKKYLDSVFSTYRKRIDDW